MPHDRHQTRPVRSRPRARLRLALLGGGRDAGGAVDRLSPEDMMSLAADAGSAPMQVGAAMVLEADGPIDVDALVSTLGQRIVAVPRLRQRLEAVPLGCGRPIWVDDRSFDIARQVRVVAWPDPGDEDALLAVAAQAQVSPLPPEGPLWRAIVVTGLDGSRVGLIIVFHHVLADGVGGLAVLASLVDGGSLVDDPDFPRPAPSRGTLVRDVWRERFTGLANLPHTWHRARAAFGQLRQNRTTTAARCSLNRPTGPRRRFAVARVDLESLRGLAHTHGVTINDVVLTAVGGGLRTLLASRGESISQLVVSVPVSARQQAQATELGNQADVIPIAIPLAGEPLDRLHAVAARTRVAKHSERVDTNVVLGPLFRLLAAARLFRWFIDRQRLVHTFVTNLHGPDDELTLLGARLAEIVALADVTGNVTVSTAVLSYAGTVALTVIADPDACPELDELRDAIAQELDRLLAAPTTGPVRPSTR